MKDFLLSGFLSPWRWARRRYWRRRFHALGDAQQHFARFGRVDPDALIARGLL